MLSKNELKRNAFTLVELLVVIAVIGILIAILIPAVQAVRASARRVQCSNHVRQLAIAVHHYHDARKRFPVNEVGPGPLEGGVCEGGYYSWLVYVLPYMEYNNLYSQIHFDMVNSDSCDQGIVWMSDTHPNAVVASTRIDVFLCPSDSPAFNSSVVMGSANFAPDNYAANAGWPSYTTGFDGERTTRGAFNGVIANVNPGDPVGWHGGGRIRFASIRDGTSNTALIAERIIQSGDSYESIQNYDRRVASVHVTEAPRTLAEMDRKCDPELTHVDAFESAFIGRAWMSGYALTGSTYQHLKTPNTNCGHFGDSRFDGDFIVTPSSWHPAGVNVALCDASIQVVHDQIDKKIWWAMGSRNGAEADFATEY